MAVAEARAAWQRTANRCFVQEDAKRAPKLACCQQSSAASTKQVVVDSEPSGTIDVPDHSLGSFIPLYENHAHPNLPADTKWWLQMQPSCSYQKGLSNQWSKTREEDSEILNSSFMYLPFEVDSNVYRENYEFGEQVLEDFGLENVQEFADLTEPKKKCEFVEMDTIGFPVKLNETYFEPESPWISSNKTDPWWRTTDKDDLAFLVAQKSLDNIENCDLPTPRKVHSSWCSDFTSGSIVHDQSSRDSLQTPTSQEASVQNRHMGCVSEKSFCFRYSDSRKNTREMSNKTETQASESDLIKAELLEALRHSQTRAREAEIAAKEANASKEHIIRLFFRQASQLFAYKQWFQLLQLETLYLQIKNDDGRTTSTCFSAGIPWMPCGGRKPRKRRKGKKGNLGRERSGDVSKCFVAFALGFSLVGAGLLLGWTLGWMLPL